MSEYTATVIWTRKSEKFTDNKYARAHEWTFDGGLTVPASSSPLVLPPPMSDEKAVDPEEAFVASLSSCHMLWFLAIAAKRGFIVDSYKDEAVGIMEKNPEGKKAVTRVILRPTIEFAGDNSPDDQTLDEMHEEAHDKCFIANSVKTEVTVQVRQAAV